MSGPENALEAHPDAPRRDDLDRFALYVVDPKALANIAGMTEDLHRPSRSRRRVFETCREGIGLGIEMLYAEAEIPRGWRIGILDRRTRFWIVNPFV